MPGSTRLSDSEVRNRLETCTDSPDVIDEIYNFGQILLKEAVDRIKTTESKATAFAAYGSAIVTLLVSTSSLWYRLGNQWTLWIAACAGLSGFACAMLSIKGLLVRTFYVISQDEWLNATCLSTAK